jgi:hypothetical protein
MFRLTRCLLIGVALVGMTASSASAAPAACIGTTNGTTVVLVVADPSGQAVLPCYPKPARFS